LIGRMRKMVAYLLCTCGMVGVYFATRFLILGISDDFGLGFLAGGFTIAVMIALAEHVSKPRAS